METSRPSTINHQLESQEVDGLEGPAGGSAEGGGAVAPAVDGGEGDIPAEYLFDAEGDHAGMRRRWDRVTRQSVAGIAETRGICGFLEPSQ